MLGSAIETPGLRRELEKAENLVLVLAPVLLSLLLRLMVLGLGIHGSGGREVAELKNGITSPQLLLPEKRNHPRVGRGDCWFAIRSITEPRW